ncbi:DNA polymerase gamma, catalytic subunit tam isoform 1-T1 [Glossina fuscipes fuscipes]
MFIVIYLFINQLVTCTFYSFSKISIFTMIKRYYSSKAVRKFYPHTQIKIFRKTDYNSATKLANIQNSKNNAFPKSAEKILETNEVRTLSDKELTNNNNTKSGSQNNKKDANTSSEYYENLARIQMLSTNLHKQLFPQAPRFQVDVEEGKKYNLNLKRHGIEVDCVERLKDVNIKLPPLKGNNIERHFYQIGKDQVKPYEDLLIPLVQLKQLPAKPERWILKEGWTVYDTTTKEHQSINWPLEDGLVLDVEVCISEGAMPTIATAVSTKHWYSWVSPRLLVPQHEITAKQEFPRYTLEDLIPLGKRTPKLIVGHNVSYDRARLREQYLIEDTGVRFLDTMSLHMCVSGVTSYQRALMKSKKEPAAEDVEWLSQSCLNSLADVHSLYCGGAPISKEERNIFISGNLDDIRFNFQKLMNYCAQDVEATQSVLHNLYPLFAERFPHPVTLAGMLEISSAYLPVNKNWWRYISESDLTYEDLNIEAKYHLARRADEACSLMKNEQYKNNLWLWDEDWSTQELKLKKVKSITKKKPVDNNLKETDYILDLPSTEEEEYLCRKFKYLHDTRFHLPVKRPLLPGYPAWYRKLCQKIPKDLNRLSEWSPGPSEISTGMQIAPKLLSLCWEGYPLHYSREHGWGFLVPFRVRSSNEENLSLPHVPIEELVKRCPIPKFLQDHATKNETEYAFGILNKELNANLGKREFYAKAAKKDGTNGLYKGSGVWCGKILDDCCFFLKLPHKNGKSLRVGNPLSRDFLNKFSENVLSSGEDENTAAARVISIARMMSYWRNNRDRIISQLVVWLTPDQLSPQVQCEQNYQYGAICPQVVVCGTLTRRAMEPTWLTASNSKVERIGSELRAMVQAPPGYRIVGADVDSQELWIASVLGDAYAHGVHGSTPFGWMTLSGTKTNGTDMHSITAKAVGISRDHAKVINYARIYGAGQNFAEGLLKQFNPTFSGTEARNKAMKMFSLTKGKKVYKLKKDYQQEYENRSYSSYEALKLASCQNRSVNEMFLRACWEGGTESAMFNRLEEIATGEEPVTPFLQCRLSRALETYNTDEYRFLPTRINWVVQSGAVDFLHLMLVSMRWLLGTKARFCLSFHDEIRYLVKEEDAYTAALAMHVTNLLTRSFCCSRLGLNDLPMSVAFFSSVEVDTVLRKESSMDCKTPSNPHGLHIGYGIAPGESLNIYEAIRKANCNDLSQWKLV